MQCISRNIVTALLIGSILLADNLITNPALAQDQFSCKPVIPVKRTGGLGVVSQDFGDVAVLVDNGLMVTARNLFDLNGTTVRFTPAGAGQFTVSHSAGALDPDFGPALTFGYPGATLFPGDDDTQNVLFPAGFPFFGTTYTSVWVNTDGNVTFGTPDYASDDRDKVKHVLGPPRVSAFLMDMNPNNALNPAGSGTIHAIAKTSPDRLVVTWNNLADFQGDGSSTFQIRLYASGVVEITIDHLDPAAKKGVVGIAQGQGLIQVVDLSASTQTLPAGAIVEAFSEFTTINDVQIAREFYKTHPDKFDFLTINTDFSADGRLPLFYFPGVSNNTHGIGTQLNPPYAQPAHPATVFDDSAIYGSAGELEQIMYMNNIFLFPASPDEMVNPRIEPYSSSVNDIRAFDALGGPVTLDGQVLSQVRVIGTMPPDDGEFSRFFDHGGPYSLRIGSLMSLMALGVEHRWGANLRFVHPTKGVGIDSYDLLGREFHHWSYFFNTGVPDSQFPDAPRGAATEGNAIVDLGALANYNGTPITLSPGERVFMTPANALMDGYCALDQYLMGLQRADEVGSLFYVDEPASIYTSQSLDVLDPAFPLNPYITMRGWEPMGGIVFKGKRVDLTIQNIMDYEAIREGNDNPKGKRFWGPKGNLKVRYFSSTGRVDPNGDATVTLTESDRELSDEADRIDANGKPVDIKTMAFILVVQSGDPSAHSAAISRVDAFRQAWHTYANGPATGGRGRFETRLNPPIY